MKKKSFDEADFAMLKHRLTFLYFKVLLTSEIEL